jgi:alanine racemase
VIDLSAIRDNVHTFRRSVPQDILAVIKADAFGHGAVTVRGIWSHLSHGDAQDAVQSRKQLQLLRTGITLARRAGLQPTVIDLANSAGAITLDAPDCNLVRIGAGLYGIDELGIGLRPAMRLVSKLAQVRRIPAGEGVSYGHDYVADCDTTVALVPLGYADGIRRVAVGQASVLCRGVRMPVIGRIAMDQFVVDAGDVPVEPGEPVTIFGDGTDGEPTAEDWAGWAGTIPHEIYCGIGTRVQRRYEEAGR